MDDLFKKFINTGVGFLSQGNKAVQKAIEKLVQESKISEQEGKKIVDDLLKSSETKRTDLEKQFKTLTEDLKTRVGRKGEATNEPTAPKAKAAAKTAPKSAAKQPAASPAAKAPAAKKPAASPAAAAGTTKKAADKVSAAAEKAQRSATAKASAPKKAPILSADDSGETLATS
jgi:polyhydroxyalkanoate synthesis regulator phasin